MWLQASKSVLCSQLSGEVLWVAFASVGDGPMECNVVPRLVEDPLLCCAESPFI